MTEFQAWQANQRKVDKIAKELTGDEKIEVYSGCYDKAYVTILKVNDQHLKFFELVTE